MIIIFNIIVLAVAALITYWWANQGVFSALLHLLCVIAAGAIAFGLWELITVNFLLSGGWFDDYAWGICFLVLFLGSLVVLRVAMDRFVPSNLNFPTWVNLSIGGVLGASAAILTVGLVLIGSGFIQSSRVLGGYAGNIRSNTGQPVDIGGMWMPFHRWTANFYSFLSVGSMSPMLGEPLRTHYPNIDRVALSQFRDSYSGGKAKTSITPDSVELRNLYYSPQRPAVTGGGPTPGYGAVFQFSSGAFDGGNMLTLSSSQIRMVADAVSAEPGVAHPDQWSQMTRDLGASHFLFDDPSHYVTSVPGQEEATVFIEFPARPLDSRKPKFIQVKGLRIPISNIEEISSGQWNAMRSGGFISGGSATVSPSAPQIAANDVKVSNRVEGLNLNKNRVSSMELIENTLAAGRAEFNRDSGGFQSRKLRINAFYEPQGTKVIQVNVSRRNSSADLWKRSLREKVSDNEAPVLVDKQGGIFTPVGYIWYKQDGKIEINLVPQDRINALSDLPSLPSSGAHELWLIYRATTGASIAGLNVGDETVVQMDVTAE